MTSLLSPMRLGVFDLPKLSAHFPSHILFDVQADNDHSLPLPVTIDGEGSKPDAYQIPVLSNFRDEVRITVLRPFIENEDWRARGSGLPDDGHHSTSRRSI